MCFGRHTQSLIALLIISYILLQPKLYQKLVITGNYHVLFALISGYNTAQLAPSQQKLARLAAAATARPARNFGLPLCDRSTTGHRVQ